MSDTFALINHKGEGEGDFNTFAKATQELESLKRGSGCFYTALTVVAVDGSGKLFNVDGFGNILSEWSRH